MESTGRGESFSSVAVKTSSPLVKVTVEVSVIATDSKGLPVSGLGVSDFRVLDNGREQTIATFEKIGSRAAPGQAELPPNTYSNRAGEAGSGPLGKAKQPQVLSMILLDAVNTKYRNQTVVRRAVVPPRLAVAPLVAFAPPKCARKPPSPFLPPPVFIALERVDAPAAPLYVPCNALPAPPAMPESSRLLRPPHATTEPASKATTSRKRAVIAVTSFIACVRITIDSVQEASHVTDGSHHPRGFKVGQLPNPGNLRGGLG